MSYVRNLKVTDRRICAWNPWHNDLMRRAFPLSFLRTTTGFLLAFFLLLVHLLLTDCWFVFHVACLPLSPQCIVSAPVWFVTCVCIQACLSGLCESLLFGSLHQLSVLSFQLLPFPFLLVVPSVHLWKLGNYTSLLVFVIVWFLQPLDYTVQKCLSHMPFFGGFKLLLENSQDFPPSRPAIFCFM